jgi:16S rRNA (cytidine1402-2'-O)-methyltransferase
MSGTLYIVATPIGNLEDLSPRARRILAEVELIAAEDTRHTGRLLSQFGITTPLKSLHEHNESAEVGALLDALADGRSIALVSDAGTPLVSDPGYRLVSAARDRGFTVSPVPGPSALTAALSVAGLPTDRFCFEGFLPARRAARRSAIRSLVNETRTLVFYESVHRIEEMLEDLVAGFGPDRPACIGRELTKLHEQVVSGTLQDLARVLDTGDMARKGEFVVVVAGGEPAVNTFDAEALVAELADTLPLAQAAAIVARLTGGKRNEIYRQMLERKK